MNKIVLWVFRIIPALLFLQTLWFKFTAAPEAVYIFETLGMEPSGRIIIGVLELVTAVCLLFNATVIFGGLLGFGLMVGAIYFHITKLGIVVQHDGGLLFGLALANFVMTGIVLYCYRTRLPFVEEIFK